MSTLNNIGWMCLCESSQEKLVIFWTKITGYRTDQYIKRFYEFLIEHTWNFPYVDLESFHNIYVSIRQKYRWNVHINSVGLINLLFTLHLAFTMASLHQKIKCFQTNMTVYHTSQY